jgi:hypothetical protein
VDGLLVGVAWSRKFRKPQRQLEDRKARHNAKRQSVILMLRATVIRHVAGRRLVLFHSLLHNL